MSRPVITKITLAWWHRWYVLGVVAMSRIAGLEPDHDKVCAWTRRAINTEIVR